MEESEHYPYLRQQLKGISVKPILSVANYISLDVECIVAGSSDRSIRFLDTDNLQEIAKCTVDKKSVNFVAVSEMSPEGDDPVIATGGKDSVVQIWDPTSGSVDKSITMPTTEIRSLSIYQGVDLLIIMVGSKDGQVYVWDVRNNQQIAHFRGHKASIHCVCIAPCSSSIDEFDRDITKLFFVSGGADRTVRSWNIKTGKKINKFRHARSVSSMVVTNRGVMPLLATAGVERMIKLWDLKTGVLLRTFDGHLDQINTLALWEGLQMLLISGSSDNTIRIYDMLSGECICILLGHSDAVLSLAITNASDPILVSTSEDLSLIQWDMNLILNDFYYSDESGDLAGARNGRAPWLPRVNYNPPDELDRGTLSKDERKRIRKERKKEKRKRNLSMGLRASFDGNLLDGDDEEEWRQFADDLGDLSDDEAEQLRPVEAIKSPATIVSSNLLLQIAEKNNMRFETVPPVSSAAPALPAEEKEAPLVLSRPPSNAALLPRSSSGASIKDWFKKTLGLNSTVVPLDIQEHSSGAVAAVAVEGQQASDDTPMEEGKSAVSPISPVSAEATPVPEAIPPSTDPLIAEGVHVRITDEDAAAAGAASTLHSETTPAPLPPLSMDQETKGQEAKDLETMTETASEAISNVPFSARSEAQIARQRQGSMLKEEDFKAKARSAQSNFAIASIERELEVDRQKSKAAEKLQQRLQLKKKLVQHNHHADDLPSEEAKNDAELNTIKAEKLKQHKLQENRRKQSMAVAQQRSAEALQKRLEELAKKKQLAPTTEGGEEGDTSSSEDER